MRVFKVALGVGVLAIGGVVAQGCAKQRAPVEWQTGQEATVERLSVERVLRAEPMDAVLLEVYEEVKGDSLEEKNHNAETTLEMKAVGAAEVFAAEKALNASALELLNSLPEQDEEARQLFLRTHNAWREYAKLQAEWRSLDGRGGTIHSIYYRSALLDELNQRRKFYDAERAAATDETWR